MCVCVCVYIYRERDREDIYVYIYITSVNSLLAYFSSLKIPDSISRIVP